ncbi:MAG: J domain-containing protein [Nitriliruptoraceae bacterium]|nr:J domain-containing protein [Nitriliruptoraceae bacterium]
MERPLTREEAARTLGVSVAADATACKRAYRRLAREHHPDRGGDPGTFHALQAAYERMVAETTGPRRPTVARGRPSTPPVPFVDTTRRHDLDTVDWSAPVPDGRLVLDRDLVARLLARTGPTVAPLRATSRAPGSRWNRAAHLLATELTSTLRVTPVTDDRGRAMVRAEIVAASRRGRRALEQATITDGWVRRRRPSTTSLSVTLPPSEDRRATALRTAEHLEQQLARVGWELPAWTLERSGNGSSATPS